MFLAWLDAEPVDLVVGSGAFRHLVADRSIGYVELGFPSYLSHALAPRPYLGFQGARVLVESLLNALLRTDERR